MIKILVTGWLKLFYNVLIQSKTNIYADFDEILNVDGRCFELFRRLIFLFHFFHICTEFRETKTIPACS